MNKLEYELEHHKIAKEYSTGLIEFEEYKLRIRQLEDHAHEYSMNAYGEKTCWCGTYEA
jgi:hypothetical protein